MTGPASFPREAVAALFIERQWLDRPRGRRLTERSLAGFAERTGGVQIDTINVLDRAHHLTLWSRFGPYDRARLHRLIYGRRVLFEYWSHAACFVPRAHARSWRRAMVDYRIQHSGWSSWLRKNGPLLRRIEAAIRESGPLGNVDFRQPRPSKAGDWWGWKPAAHGLHYLWMTGRLLVHERVHFQKRLDLAERVLPELASLEPPSWEEFMRWHLLQSLLAMGAATETDLRMYLSFPRVALAMRRRALESLLKGGAVVEIAVEGDRATWYARAEDVAALGTAGRKRRVSRGTTLLSPFDSLLWHRDRVRKLFGFDYRVEIYTPGHKRVHGYYSLPIYHDGHLIGRLDAKNHRAARRLEVRSIHFEPWFARGVTPPGASWGRVDRDAALAGLGEAVGSLARFIGADRVSGGRVSPRAIAIDLTRSLETESARHGT